MKKLLALFLSAILFIACTGNSDSKNKENNTSTGSDTSHHGDTSSYERMPNKTSDSTPH